MESRPDLSATELAVLEMLGQGCRTSEIAKRLSLQYRTVVEIIRKIKSTFHPQSPEELRELARHYRDGSDPR